MNKLPVPCKSFWQNIPAVYVKEFCEKNHLYIRIYDREHFSLVHEILEEKDHED